MCAKVLYADADRVSIVAIGRIPDEADARIALSNHGRGALAQIIGWIGMEFHSLLKSGLIAYEYWKERKRYVYGSWRVAFNGIVFLRQREKKDKRTDTPSS